MYSGHEGRPTGTDTEGRGSSPFQEHHFHENKNLILILSLRYTYYSLVDGERVASDRK